MTKEHVELRKELIVQSDALRKAAEACIRMVDNINNRCLHEESYEVDGILHCDECAREW